MILNYQYNKYRHNLDISYIEDDGMKRLLSFNVNRFKSYYRTPVGKFTNWDGSKCDEKMTENPSKFDIKTFIYELPEQYKKLLSKRTFPKLYTFDIETAISDDFPEPSKADQEITVISVCSPNLNTIVLGTHDLKQSELDWINQQFGDYVENVEFYHTLGIPKPTFKYVKFNNESDMLTYFLKNIAAKVPILSGWNCTLFDWQYIQNRIKNYYPDLSIKWASCKGVVKEKKFTTKKNEDIYLQMPLHTLVLDMMDIIENEDHAVLPLKESMQLDYIAHETLGVNKISYKGSLQDLYDNDYPRYVFYNAIDSVLVQLIVHRFKVMDHIYLYSLYCNEQIDSCFSKIALTEALTFKDFYEKGLKIVWDDKETERSRLIGAYVKKPIAGIHGYVCCNDFSGLYPATIRTCNLSFENYIRSYHDVNALAPYISDPKYIVIGPNVYTNKGTVAKPELGDFVKKCLLEDQLEQFRKDPNYFVSINGSVYHNDKDYAFRRIQATLKATRDHDKYLSKDLEAHVMHDLKRIMDNKDVESHMYADNEVQHLVSMGFDITSSDDLISMSETERKEFKRVLKDEIEYLGANEQAMKLLMNSMYGGCSHVAFYWYNMDLANDITGESRNLIHMMEHHIPDWFRNNWVQAKDLHKQLGIEVDEEQAQKALEQSPLVTEAEDKDAYHQRSFVYAAYGDSCDGDTKIATTCGDIKIKDLFNRCPIKKEERGKEFGISDYFIKNYDGEKQIISPIKYVIRHKTNKSKWIIETRYNKVTVTGDHSMIVIEKGRMKTIKPSEMSEGMIVYTLENGVEYVKSVKQSGYFEDEYVYDIEVDTDDSDKHNFFGNGILIHNTDSVDAKTIIHTDEGDKTIEEFYNDNSNNVIMTQNGHELVKSNSKVLNWTEEGGLHYNNINYIMRHKVTKSKWKLRTKSGKEVIVTNDHSMIVFRDGKQLEVKPYEILKTDKVLIKK